MNHFHAKTVREAAFALAAGGMAIIYDHDDREAEGDLAFAGRSATPTQINFCLKNGGGLVCLAMRPSWAEALGITRQPSNGADRFQTPFGNPINLIGGSSGISASDRSRTMRAASANGVRRTDFYYPGHVHTLISHPLGLAGRVGHTEAVLDILNLGGVDGPGGLCEVLDDNGEPANFSHLEKLAGQHQIPLVRIDWIREVLGHSLETDCA